MLVDIQGNKIDLKMMRKILMFWTGVSNSLLLIRVSMQCTSGPRFACPGSILWALIVLQDCILGFAA